MGEKALPLFSVTSPTKGDFTYTPATLKSHTMCPSSVVYFENADQEFLNASSYY